MCVSRRNAVFPQNPCSFEFDCFYTTQYEYACLSVRPSQKDPASWICIIHMYQGQGLCSMHASRWSEDTCIIHCFISHQGYVHHQILHHGYIHQGYMHHQILHHPAWIKEVKFFVHLANGNTKGQKLLKWLLVWIYFILEIYFWLIWYLQSSPASGQVMVGGRDVSNFLSSVELFPSSDSCSIPD